jgi:hypothetical protein
MYYGSVTWTITQNTEQILCTFERKILRIIGAQYKIKDAGVLGGIVTFIIYI